MTDDAARECGICHGTRKGDWFSTASGVHFYPLDPRPEDFRLYDIANSLSKLPRFLGHLRCFYSVAQHSVLVSELCPEHPVTGLLHESPESVICDMPSPLKYQPEMRAYRDIEKPLEKCAFARYLPLREWYHYSAGRAFEMPADVREMDRRMLVTEAIQLHPHGIEGWSGEYQMTEPVPIRIRPWGWRKARRRFVQRYEKLAGKKVSWFWLGRRVLDY